MSLPDYEFVTKPPLFTARRVWIFSSIAVALIAAVIGARPLYHASKAWRARGLAAVAEQLRVQKKYPESVSKARVALSLAPTEPATLRIVARLNSLSGGPDATHFWKQLLKQSSATPEDRRHAALYALATNQLGFAEEEIRHLLTSAADDLGALELAIQLSLKKQEPIAALAFAERLLAKDPQQAFARLNRAQLVLLTPDLAKAAQAPSPLRTFEATLPRISAPARGTPDELRADLRTLTEASEHRVEALRLLIVDAQRRHAPEQGLEYTRQLLADPGWNFEDRLLHLNLLAEVKSPEIEDAIENLLQVAATRVEAAVLLGSWLLAHGRAQQLLDKLPIFNENVQSAEAIKLLHADTCAALGRWSEVEALLKNGLWHRFELPRNVALARALRAQDRIAEFRIAWRDLVAVNEHNRAGLLQLLHFAGNWSWADEQEELLWKILERFPNESGAEKMLVSFYLDKGRTTDLCRLFDRLLTRNPQNAELKNNSAILSLLLSRQIQEATSLAREAHEADPSNPDYSCTYAYGLHRTGQSAVALELMRALPAEALSRPNTAAYFAVLLRETGDLAGADGYAAVATRGRLLPEERKLLNWTESEGLRKVLTR